jgi:hypothetical protein
VKTKLVFGHAEAVGLLQRAHPAIGSATCRRGVRRK